MTELLPRSEFGPVLRDWRQRRRRSQLALASDAGVSQRHISFLETGRSNPSREMVVHLGVVLDLPLRDRNAMLLAAGFAPVYAERSLDDPDLASVRRALEMMLEAHDPFPAYIIDRHWNLALANEAAHRLIARMPPSVQEHAGNVMHLVCHPDGLRTISPQWRDAAAVILRRLQSEVSSHPNDQGLVDLLADALDYPGVPDRRELGAAPSVNDVLIPLTVDLDGTTFEFFTTIAALMGPVDVTLEELRLETLLPANTATETALRQLQRHAT